MYAQEISSHKADESRTHVISKRVQILELEPLNIQLFACTVNEPKCTSLAHRLIASPHGMKVTLQSTFSLNPNPASSSLSSFRHKHGSCTGAVQLAPITIQASINDVHRITDIFTYLSHNYGEAQQEEENDEEKVVISQVAPQQECLVTFEPLPIDRSESVMVVAAPLNNAHTSVISLGFIEFLELSAARISVIIINDLAGKTCPLLHFSLSSLTSSFHRPPSLSLSPRGFISCRISVEYFDVALVEWNVIIQPQTYKISVEGAGGVEQAEGSKQKEGTAIQIECEDVQEICISDRLLATLSAAWTELIAQERKSQELHASSSSSSLSHPATRHELYSPYRLLNQTQFPICVWVRKQEGIEIPEEMKEGEEEEKSSTPPLLPSPDVNSPLFTFIDPSSEESLLYQAQHSGDTSKLYISLQIGGQPQHMKDTQQQLSAWEAILDIPISKVGSQVYELKSLDPRVTAVRTLLLISVSLHLGSKLVTLRSLTSITNSTMISIDVRLVGKGEAVMHVGSVAPQSTLSLPIDTGEFEWYAVEYTPTNFGMSWSNAMRRHEQQRDTQAFMAKCHLLEENGSPSLDASASSFVCHVVSTRLHHAPPHVDTSALSIHELVTASHAYEEMQLNILPPLTLTNIFIYQMEYQMKYANRQDLITRGMLQVSMICISAV